MEKLLKNTIYIFCLATLAVYKDNYAANELSKKKWFYKKRKCIKAKLITHSYLVTPFS